MYEGGMFGWGAIEQEALLTFQENYFESRLYPLFYALALILDNYTFKS